MNEEVAVTSILDNEALTSSLGDEKASKLLGWASKLLKVIAQENDGQVEEVYLDSVKGILKQVNQYYSAPDGKSLIRTKAILKVGGYITFLSMYFDEHVLRQTLQGLTKDTFVDCLVNDFPPGGENG